MRLQAEILDKSITEPGLFVCFFIQLGKHETFIIYKCFIEIDDAEVSLKKSAYAGVVKRICEGFEQVFILHKPLVTNLPTKYILLLFFFNKSRWVHTHIRPTYKQAFSFMLIYAYI